jgi:hypothetical protein
MSIVLMIASPITFSVGSKFLYHTK